MFRHILVPLDGSHCAEQALPTVGQLARATGATVTLLTVVDMALSYLVGVGMPYVVPERGRFLAEPRSYLDRLARSHELDRVEVKLLIVTGHPAASIIAVAEEQNIDLIVMSSHGYTGFRRWMMGSIAEKVARHSPAPVLVLREEHSLLKERCPDEAGGLRALIPLDTSSRAQDSIPAAAALVSALSAGGQGTLHLTQIVGPAANAGEQKQSALLQMAGHNLDMIGESIRDGLVTNVGPELKVNFSWSAVLDSDIAGGIVRLAEQGEKRKSEAPVARCDLIAMTTHGYTGLQKWSMGSITERVLHLTHLPMLIVRPMDIVHQEHEAQHSVVVL